MFIAALNGRKRQMRQCVVEFNSRITLTNFVKVSEVAQ